MLEGKVDSRAAEPIRAPLMLVVLAALAGVLLLVAGIAIVAAGTSVADAVCGAVVGCAGVTAIAWAVGA